MIKIQNAEVFGFEAAIRGMRNPMNSWDKSDSYGECDMEGVRCCGDRGTFYVGKNDLKLMKQLVKAGTDHSKFMRMINVTCDITAPLYWWKEFDTYKVGTVRDSCSTMHKIAAKEFTLDDFSNEHLMDITDPDIDLGDEVPLWLLEKIVKSLNECREAYLRTRDKKFWWQMIQLLPSSYNQRATVQLNYQVLRNMYHSRKNHKLDEWHDFCHWIESLPYSELITDG